jgi:hypothetical protein
MAERLDLRLSRHLQPERWSRRRPRYGTGRRDHRTQEALTQVGDDPSKKQPIGAGPDKFVSSKRARRPISAFGDA